MASSGNTCQADGFHFSPRPSLVSFLLSTPFPSALQARCMEKKLSRAAIGIVCTMQLHRPVRTAGLRVVLTIAGRSSSLPDWLPDTP